MVRYTAIVVVAWVVVVSVRGSSVVDAFPDLVAHVWWRWFVTLPWAGLCVVAAAVATTTLVDRSRASTTLTCTGSTLAGAGLIGLRALTDLDPNPAARGS